MTKIIRTMPEILDVMRAKRDLLNISHETIDTISGVQPGYTSKILAPVPLKGVGYQSLGDLLGALAIGFVAVEDTEQRERVQSRWQKRKRPQRLLDASACRLSIETETPEIFKITPELKAKMEHTEHMRMLGKLGGKASAKKRMRTMGKRARQRAASHAARIRWAKRVASHA